MFSSSSSIIIVICLAIASTSSADETTTTTVSNGFLSSTISPSQSDVFDATNMTADQRSQIVAINRNDSLSPAEKQLAIDKLMLQEGWAAFQEKWASFKATAADKLQSCR